MIDPRELLFKNPFVYDDRVLLHMQVETVVALVQPLGLSLVRLPLHPHAHASYRDPDGMLEIRRRQFQSESQYPE